MISLNVLKDIMIDFEKKLQGYSYRAFDINSKEKVFIIEDSLVLYVGFLSYFERIYGEFNCDFNKDEMYTLKIEELTFNNIGFKIDIDSLIDLYNKKTKIYIGWYYKKFFACDLRTIDYRTYKVVVEHSLAEKIDAFFPNIKIKERNDSWNGVLYNFVVVEIPYYNKRKKGLGVFRITSKPYSYMVSKCRNWIKNGFLSGNFDVVCDGFEEAFLSYKGSGLKRKDILESKLTFFSVEKYIKDKNTLWDVSREVLQCAKQGEYSGVERNTYIKPTNKWKTEELVYKYIKKIYKENKVIYQHRPFFLKGKNGGQMSYDIFITGLNIAIEYQGKQHFEPVEFFGGEEGFKETKKRDSLKRKLSIENGVKLIYVNYWEDINMDLLKNKIAYSNTVDF